MPLFNSLGALMQLKLSTITEKLWFSAYDTKLNNGTTTSAIQLATNKIKTFANKVYAIGTQSAASGAILSRRDFVYGFNADTGLIDDNIMFDSTAAHYVIDMEIDSSGNKHILWNDFVLTKCSGSSVTLAKSYSTTNFGAIVSMTKDTNDYLYFITDYTATANYIYVTKINPSTYAVEWSIRLTAPGTINSINSYPMKIDSSNNIYVAFSYGAANLSLIKIDSTGVVTWSKTAPHNPGQFFYLNTDSSNNVYLTAGNTLMKFTSAGAKLYEWAVTALNNNPFVINSLNNIVLTTTDTNFVNTYTVNKDDPSTILVYTTYQNTLTSTMSLITADVNNIYIFGFVRPAGGSTRTNGCVYKLPNNSNAQALNTSYNYSYTSDNGTNFSAAGTILSSTATPSAPVATTNYTFTDYSLSFINVTVTVSNFSQAVSGRTPFTYSTPLI